MDRKEGMISCALGCWLVGAGIGVIVAALLMVMGGWGFLNGVLGGVVMAVVTGSLFSWIICKPLPETTETTVKPSAKVSPAPAAAPADPAPEVNPVQTADPVEDEAPATSAAPSGTIKPEIKPSAPLKGQAELASRKGEWSYDKPATATFDPVTAPDQSKTEETPAPAAKPARAAVAKDGKPELLTGPRDGDADDLKRISGVGPKLEQQLNALGVYHYDQVASWRKKEIEWVDSQLTFKGRIERDSWIAQAKVLAIGGDPVPPKRKIRT